MQLSDIGGEFGWIDRLRVRHAGAGADLPVPIGDDAAVLSVPAGRQVVVTTDMCVEGVHFRRDWSTAADIGWKAAAVNLSDIAAMGAVPTFAFLSIAFPPDMDVDYLDALLDGLTDCLAENGARLAGGDTNSHDKLILSVTMLGTVEAGRAWTRGGARAGDALCVTGTLGDSAWGLSLLTQFGPKQAEKMAPFALARHRRPVPRCDVARALAPLGIVRAAMDISDGLAGDLPKLCAASGVGAHVLLPALPRAVEGPRMTQEDQQRMAFAGGEDYELLLAVAPADISAARVACESVGVPLTVIGEVVPSGLSLVDADGTEHSIAAHGWDHFGG